MRALSLWQPWASLMAMDAKRIETRSWMTTYTGPVAVHATAGFPPEAQLLCLEEPFYSTLFGHGILDDTFRGLDWPTPRARVTGLPRGAVVATAVLVGCEPTDSAITEALLRERGDDERLFGDYTPGRWAWFFENIEALPEPVPAVGARGLWEWRRDQPARPAGQQTELRLA